MSKMQLGYWDLRGYGEPARMLMEYGGIDYEDVRYELGEDGEKDSWLKVKHTLGMHFPNLPYLLDRDVKLSESWAIYKYIASKIDLLPKTEKEENEGAMLAGVIQDFRNAFMYLCYSPDYEDIIVEVAKSQTEKLELFGRFLTGRQYLLGDRLTWIDFPFFDTLDHHRLLFSNILDNFPRIQGFLKRFESKERIAAYFNSDRYKKFPITGKNAMWGKTPR